jgi:hypothetical protein
MKKRQLTSIEKHKFQEERARNVLTYIFPIKYKETVLQDSPDIYIPNSCIGIEVTDSTKTLVQENASWASDITGKTSEELSYNDNRHIKNHDISISVLPNGQYSAVFAFWGDEHDILSAYYKKLNKLNSKHFNRYNENNLFIYAWMIDKDDIENEITKIIQHDQKINSNLSYKFDYIYIFTGKVLYCITMKNADVEIFTIPENMMQQISNASFIKVLGISRDEFYGNQ